VCTGLYSADQLCALNRDCYSDCYCLFAVRCALMRKLLSAVSYEPFTHSRHNADDRNVKVGYEIMVSFSLTILSDMFGFFTLCRLSGRCFFWF